MLPRYIEDERDFGARSVHVVIVFPNPGGWGQATNLRLQLEAGAARMFDAATFGRVYPRAVSAPYMVSAPTGVLLHACCTGPDLPACMSSRRHTTCPLNPPSGAWVGRLQPAPHAASVPVTMQCPP